MASSRTEWESLAEPNVRWHPPSGNGSHLPNMPVATCFLLRCRAAGEGGGEARPRGRRRAATKGWRRQQQVGYWEMHVWILLKGIHKMASSRTEWESLAFCCFGVCLCSRSDVGGRRSAWAAEGSRICEAFVAPERADGGRGGGAARCCRRWIWIRSPVAVP